MSIAVFLLAKLIGTILGVLIFWFVIKPRLDRDL